MVVSTRSPKIRFGWVSRARRRERIEDVTLLTTYLSPIAEPTAPSARLVLRVAQAQPERRRLTLAARRAPLDHSGRGRRRWRRRVPLGIYAAPSGRRALPQPDVHAPLLSALHRLAWLGLGLALALGLGLGLGLGLERARAGARAGARVRVS